MSSSQNMIWIMVIHLKWHFYTIPIIINNIIFEVEVSIIFNNKILSLANAYHYSLYPSIEL